jgi:DNA transformation protein and related proteins
MRKPVAGEERIRNLGPVSRMWLAAIDVHSLDELRAIGALDAYRLLALRGYSVSLNLLWGMVAALQDVHWMEITPEQKAQLRAELEKPWDPTPYLQL